MARMKILLSPKSAASVSFLSSVSSSLDSGETSGGIATSSAPFASRSPHLPSSPLFPVASSLRRQAAAGLLLLLSHSSLLLSFAPTGGDNNNTAGSSARYSSSHSAATPVRTAGQGELPGEAPRPSLLLSGEDSTSHRRNRQRRQSAADTSLLLLLFSGN